MNSNYETSRFKSHLSKSASSIDNWLLEVPKIENGTSASEQLQNVG